jgi:RNA polymerase sigma-54 factor
MELKVQATQRQEQRLALLPKMLQSIEVLQMTTADLLLRIQAEVEQNELLEVLSEPVELELPADDSGEDEDSMEAQRPRNSGAEEVDRKQQFLNNVADSGSSLLDYITEQVACLDLPNRLAAAVLTLADQLDERGLLTLTDHDLQQFLSHDLIPAALTVLQSLEPRGIGARNTIDAMLLQLPDHDPDLADIEAMLTQHLEALSRNKLPDVAKALGRTIDEIQQLLERIGRLDPRPAARFRSDDTGVVTPDVVVRLEGDEPVIEVDDMLLPDLGIADGYELLAASKETTPDIREYLSKKLHSARGLIDAVDQRRRTLGRVTAAIMQHQREFLHRGKSALRPLRMSEVAAELGLHPSTISRAINGKHVQTDRGILPLREFFDGNRRAAPTECDGAGRLAIKERIQQLIAAEDSRAPLSDDDLVRLLAAKEIHVARRTVAKYRRELDIPSSYRRRSYQDYQD